MDTPLRIVHLLLTSRFAGTERHVVELANSQAAMGHDVTVILRAKGAQPRADAIAHRLSGNVRVVVVGNLLSSQRARRRVRAMAPDIAHAHLSGGCRALRGLRMPSTRRIATLHIRYKPQQHADLDGLIAIAPWQLAALPPALRKRSLQIDNWTLPRTSTPGARARVRTQYGIGENDIVFGTLGRIESSKGLDVLLAAWKRAALPDDARLVMVGQGDAWPELRQAAPASVLMPGFAAAAGDWLDAFDVFVSPARDEPFGLVLLEAMEAGLPILASASEGARHLRHAIEAPLLPIDDAAALAAALAQHYRERQPRRAYPLDAFRIETKLAQIEAFYRAALEPIRAASA